MAPDSPDNLATNNLATASPTTDSSSAGAVVWARLRDVPDLEEYLDADPERFTEEVQRAFEQWRTLPADQLEAVALLRALEVTNGCVQWAFRRKLDGHLGVERTRACMKTVMGFMVSKQIRWPDGAVVDFDPSVVPWLDAVRGLYIAAFKNGDAAAARSFYAQSAGQFLALGRERMRRAFGGVEDQFGELFGEDFLERGRRYAARFLAPSPEAMEAPEATRGTPSRQPS
ncbi:MULTISPECIES: hypothetical protein [Aphanothece]|uniref:hypothetical protein n=1 Tax=Aphanothece TaxID=1121 RepID=UPI003984FBF6